MKKSFSRKLNLNKVTVDNLNKGEMVMAGGGETVTDYTREPRLGRCNTDMCKTQQLCPPREYMSRVNFCY
ncbi:MAG: hypothetical protein GY765_41045 [bacterium]|nr:hypothetical protein [bacterium]